MADLHLDLATRRLALRHKYEFDAIATKDRGSSFTDEISAAQLSVFGWADSNGSPIAVSSTIQHSSAPAPASVGDTSRSSINRKRREENSSWHSEAPPHKRARPISLLPRDTGDRYEVAPLLGRPGWNREDDRSWEHKRGRDGTPSGRFDHTSEGRRNRPPASTVPSLLNWFMSTLPKASEFRGEFFISRG